MTFSISSFYFFFCLKPILFLSSFKDLACHCDSCPRPSRAPRCLSSPKPTHEPSWWSPLTPLPCGLLPALSIPQASPGCPSRCHPGPSLRYSGHLSTRLNPQESLSRASCSAHCLVVILHILHLHQIFCLCPHPRSLNGRICIQESLNKF